MSRGTTALALASALVISGCAGVSRTVPYGFGLADAKVAQDGHGFSIWVHPSKDALLVQEDAAMAITRAFFPMTSVKLVDYPEIWRKAAQQLTDPVGCQVTTLEDLDHRTSYEAGYACPPGVNLRALIHAQRGALRLRAGIHR